MENTEKKRYVVETKYGYFSLDEGAYRDFVNGRSWLNWQPWRQAEPRQPLPPQISEEASRLRDCAEKNGVLELLSGEGTLPLQALPERLRELPLQELDMTVRASNGLMRAGADNVGRVLEQMAYEGGLMRLRNLGAKSVAEIRRVVLTECYARMTEDERGLFWEEILRRRKASPEAC